jgi:outer membrane lipoprotein-sorting protein
VLRLIVDEFWRLQRERVSERELSDAKAYLTGSFPLTIETPESIAMQVVNVLFYGLPVDQLQTFRERVNAVTADDIQRVARAYLKPDRLSIVLVGNAAAFATQLKGVGFGTFESVELGDLDLMTANFKRAGTRARAEGAGPAGRAGRAGQERLGLVSLPFRTAFNYHQAPLGSRPAIEPSADERAKATALLDRAIAAKGGLEKLEGIKTIVAKQSLTSKTPQGEVQYDTESFIQFPDHFRVVTQAPAGTVVQALDGEKLWMTGPDGIHDAPEPVVREFRNSMRRDPVSLLLAAKSGALTARLLPEQPYALLPIELSATDLNPVLLYIDRDTALITKQSFTADAPGRPLVEEVFWDYRPVDGVQIAFQASRTSGPIVVTRRVTDIKINTPIDPSLFKRPAS